MRGSHREIVWKPSCVSDPLPSHTLSWRMVPGEFIEPFEKNSFALCSLWL